MILWLYGLPGIRRLAFQLSPWSVGGAWLVLAAALPRIVVPASLVGLLMVLGLRLAGIRRLAFRLRPWLLGQGWPVLAVCLLLPLAVELLAVNVLAMFGVAVPPPSPGGLSNYLYVAVIGQG
jgi:hypothetical protein